MKSVLISIQPKWVEKIAKGKKTIEVRKSRPKIETPFKCYIYCTYGQLFYVEYPNGIESKVFGLVDYKVSGKDRIGNMLNGKVIGEFICDRIDSYIDKHLDDNLSYWDLTIEEWEDLQIKSCLTIPQIIDYTGDSENCYGWHISDLKIYDKPKELSEFRKPCDRFLDCITCKRLVRNDFLSCDNIITRPPQSWQFVEYLGE